MDGSADDTLITALISAATDYVQRRVGQQFIQATLIQTWDYFDSGFWNGSNFVTGMESRTGRSRNDVLKLDRLPIVSISWVKYYDINGTFTTISSANYWTSLYSRPPRIMPISTYVWPDTQDGRPEAVQVQYVAGYANAAAVPEALKTAIKELVKHWYDNRSPVLSTGAVPQDLPYSLGDLLLLYDKTPYV